MKLKLAAAVAAVSVATVPAAFADENAGWYLGGGVGSFNVNIDNPDQINDAVGACVSEESYREPLLTAIRVAAPRAHAR
jgi:hypothetical protein